MLSLLLKMKNKWSVQSNLEKFILADSNYVNTFNLSLLFQCYFIKNKKKINDMTFSQAMIVERHVYKWEVSKLERNVCY